MKKLERPASALSVIFGYLAIVGVGVWKAMKQAKPKAGQQKSGPEGDSHEAKNREAGNRHNPEQGGQELESLSPATPGNAPLDRLARRAAAEQREEGRPEFDGPPRALPISWAHDSPVVAEVLRHQSLDSAPLRGWSAPMPARLPVPTFAPAVMALGIVIFAMGLATIWYVCVVGAIVFAKAAWRWIGEMQGS
jgi:hypothetical protein